ncbi:hypothetical protein FSP39_002223 [Pinctada imbricata]|uniref:C1q domain-containing protein n=1 Tax=Pinctada imbricata TaxID=66713 RepID=A0AA88YI67_PINIB|nr:hypothetical protein FSP39_002223 [Pinctada imbricata]
MYHVNKFSFFFCFSDSPRVNRVYFSASIKKSVTLSTQHQTIVFEDVLVNRGNAFDKSTGVFTCPIRGDYKFSFTIMKTRKAASSIVLMMNNNLQLRSYTPGLHDREMTNGDIILSLRRGDKVYLRGHDNGIGLNGDRYSMFSGQLM